jgi:hypothetical protein
LPPPPGASTTNVGVLKPAVAAAHVLLDEERGVDARPQVLDALHQVVHVDVIRVHVHVAEALHEERHRLRRCR